MNDLRITILMFITFANYNLNVFLNYNYQSIKIYSVQAKLHNSTSQKLHFKNTICKLLDYLKFNIKNANNVKQKD